MREVRLIHFFRNDEATSGNMRLVIVPGIVDGDAPVSCWLLFPMPSNSSELLAKVNSIQFPSRFLSGE